VKYFGSRCKLVVLLFLLGTLLGCSALDASQPAAQTTVGSSQITLSPKSVAFGNVPLGKTQVLSATLSNTGRGVITITHAAISGQGFALEALKLPLSLRPGQRTLIGVHFTPTSGGSNQGTIHLQGTASVRSGGRSGRHRAGTIADASPSILPISISLPVSGIGASAGQLAVSPSALSLGNVKVGTTHTESAMLANSGGSPVTVSNASVTGHGFQMSGLSFPLRLAPGQRKNFSVIFTPQAAGTSTGTIAVTSDAGNSVISLPITAIAVASGALISNPSSLSFGTVQVNHAQILPATLTNSGSSTVTVSRASISGSGFALSGVSLPLTLGPGQSTTLKVSFNPQSGGAVNASLSVISDAVNGRLAVPLSGTGATTGALNSTPTSLNFGSVPAGSPKTLAGTLVNSGGSSITITQANVSVTGFAVNGLTLPTTLAAGQSRAFSVTFTPQSGGSRTGNLSIISNASNVALTIPLSATSATAGLLSTSDSSLDFASVALGNSSTQSETLTNTGGSSVTVTQATVSGTAFKVTGLSLPLTLGPGQSFTFGALFKPTTGGTATGSISVASNASNSTLTITLAGTAAVSGQLAVSPATLNFGTVTVGQTKSLTGSLTASGSSITVSNVNTTTSEFKVSGLTLPLTLAAGKSVSFTVTFAPQASGVAAAGASFISNASNSSAQEALGGTGAAAPQHSVALNWNPGAGGVVGYNVYRGNSTGGAYSRIASMNADTSYTDSTVQAGQSYVYVTTAVDGSGKESANSNQALAVIPTP
jgi:hypothetical protein